MLSIRADQADDTRPATNRELMRLRKAVDRYRLVLGFLIYRTSNELGTTLVEPSAFFMRPGCRAGHRWQLEVLICLPSTD